ncbi:hypothetical protein OF83DRAFT_1243679 [Amylostereum chailletii]|nr:hypothetical protein OF83DRAFT_1243679 [Amylostereum chailletii]
MDVLLPTELLIEIFTFCAHTSALTPVLLAQVSRRWRDIAHTSPRIYQSVVLDDRLTSLLYSNHVAHIFLHRSQSLPFDVHVHIQSRDALLPILSPFLSHLPRWRSCHVSGAKNESIFLPDLWNRTRDGPDHPRLEPKVEQLDITLLDESDFDLADDPLLDPLVEGEDTLADVQSFRQVATFRPFVTSLTANLLNMEVFLSKLPSPIPCTPLRFVTMVITESALSVSLHPADLLHFLNLCPELEYLSFTGLMAEPDIRREDLDRPPPVVRLLHLRSLVLHSIICTRIVLSHLYVPALRELYLEHLNVDWKFPPEPEYNFEYELEDGDSDDEFPDFSQSPYSDHATGMALRSLIRRCDPPLRVLEMDYADMRTKDFRWLFERMDELEEFRIVASDMADRVVRLLAPVANADDGSGSGSGNGNGNGNGNGARRVLLPHMRNLELIDCHRLSGEAIVDAVKKRVLLTDDRSPRLEDVAIIGCANFSAEHGDELEELLGERLRLL